MSNDEVLAKAGTRGKLVETIMKRQLQFFRACFKKRRTGRRGNNWEN